MAISIDWGTYIITIPREDMTLVQSSPIEIRDLDINNFRLTLKALEETSFGMPNLKTHIHNTEVALGGITFARVVEIIDPYTVTFEDGQYAVNLTGANSNIGDKVNINNVSVRSANSAGLISNKQIEYSSFNGGVTIDVANGTAGTVFPAGTPQQPVNNLDDAYLIAEVRGLTTFYIIGDITIDESIPILDSFVFIGESQTKTYVEIYDAANVNRCEFQDMTIDGVLDGESSINQCIIEELIYVNGTIYNSLINGGIHLGGGAVAHIINCASGVPGEATPFVDMGGSGQSLGIRNYNGGIELRNKTGDDAVSIDMNSGQVILDSTVTDGTIVVRGIGKLTDYSTGTTNVLADDLLNKENIVRANWDKVWLDTTHGVAGTAFPIGTIEQPSNNIADALTILDSIGSERIHIHGEITLEQDLSDVTVEGHGYSSAIITLNSKLLTGVKFEQLTIIGVAATGSKFSGNNCRLMSVTNIRGAWDNCVCYGNYIVDTGQTWNTDRSSFPATSIINMNGSSNIGMAGVSGVIVITNSADPLNTIGVTGNYMLTLDSSCTDGGALIAGIGILTNNSSLAILNRTLPATTWDEPIADHLAPGTTGEQLSTGADPADIADAVWDESVDGHKISKTFGDHVRRIKNQKV